jgi:signal transduction histidine kinase
MEKPEHRSAALALGGGAGIAASGGGLFQRIVAAAQTTTFRIVGGAAALFVLAAALIFALLFVRTNDALTQLTLTSLRAEVQALAADAGAGLPRLTESIAARSRQPGPSLYLVLDSAGRRLAGNIDPVPAALAGNPNGGPFRYRPSPDGPEQLGVAIGVPAAGGARLFVGRDIEEQLSFAARVRNAFLLGFGLLSLAGLAGGVAISRLLLNRIEGISATSRSIMSGDLTQRVPETGSGDELDGLARNLNAMLSRIELLMASLREVSDNIAHDLKTPLNRLRNRAEAALADTRGGPAYREGLERTIEQADEIIRIFNAMLLIARLEAGAIEDTMAEVDLGQLVADCAELYEPVAQERGLELTIAAGAGPRLRGNRQLLGQAIANLVDNAIKYSAGRGSAGGGVSVAVRAGKDGPEVVVGDRGPGIAAEDRKRVLKRFVRLEKSRTEPGTGLGLSLVAAVARLHGGGIRLEDNAPGLRVVLALPRRLVSS